MIYAAIVAGILIVVSFPTALYSFVRMIKHRSYRRIFEDPSISDEEAAEALRNYRWWI